MSVAYRAEVIGSMLRPGYLQDARTRFENGELAADELRALEDRAVDEALALLDQAGVDVPPSAC